MPHLARLSCLLLIGALGCDKPSAPPPTTFESTPTQPSPSEPPADDGQAVSVTETDLPSLLAALTQAVRKYGLERQRAPKTLEELVAAGYLASVPPAPAGKKFMIDKNLQVVVAGQ